SLCRGRSPEWIVPTPYPLKGVVDAPVLRSPAPVPPLRGAARRPLPAQRAAPGSRRARRGPVRPRRLRPDPQPLRPDGPGAGERRRRQRRPDRHRRRREPGVGERRADELPRARRGLAKEIQDTRPLLVGLQEVLLFRTGVADSPLGNPTRAEHVEYDYL